MIERIFYASGPGDVIQSHRHWIENEHNPTEVSVTFSSQIQDFCKEINAQAYCVSTHRRKEILTDGAFTLEHRPKPVRRGALFHLTEVFYGLGLLRTALRFRADVALIDSGYTHYFILSLFQLFGMRVVPILYNSLWPSGFPPSKPIPRLVLRLDRLFWRRVPTAVIAISPECERQVDELTGHRHPPVFQTSPQFVPDYFEKIPPPPPHDLRPFQIMYIGRIVYNKGVFDILEMARRIEDSNPGMVHWEICGTGKDFEELKRRHQEMGLESTVNLRGWTSLEDLVGVYTRAHASIVPTRSDFSEGLAMTCAEAILAGRPVITNPVVPALEVLRPACIEAKTNDVDSHIEGVLKLATDAELYNRLCRACLDLKKQFYDREYGLTATLKRALGPSLSSREVPTQARAG